MTQSSSISRRALILKIAIAIPAVALSSNYWKNPFSLLKEKAGSRFVCLFEIDISNVDALAFARINKLSNVSFISIIIPSIDQGWHQNYSLVISEFLRTNRLTGSSRFFSKNGNKIFFKTEWSSKEDFLEFKQKTNMDIVTTQLLSSGVPFSHSVVESELA